MNKGSPMKQWFETLAVVFVAMQLSSLAIALGWTWLARKLQERQRITLFREELDAMDDFFTWEPEEGWEDEPPL